MNTSKINKHNSYKGIFKANSLFAGVQVFTIIIGFVRTKILALLLGPAGIGIYGVLNSTINLTTWVSNLGINISAVRELSKSHEDNDLLNSSKISKVLRKFSFVLGLAGSLLLIIFSFKLSEYFFLNNDNYYLFIIIAISVIFKQLSSADLSIIQGNRKLKDLAKANVIGNFIALIITLPIYYFYRIDAIGPSIVISSILIFVSSRYYSLNIKTVNVNLNINEYKDVGFSMIRLGFVLSLSHLMVLIGSYFTRIYISNTGNLTDLGFYEAGFIIVNSYVALIFNAMVTDYFPRLSATIDDNKTFFSIVNRQAEIALLFLSPMIGLFIFFNEFIVNIIYSSEFLPVVNMLYFLLLGTFFKLITWIHGYVLISKGESRIFFINELLINIHMIIFINMGYYYYGLIGLGMGYLFSYIIASLQTVILIFIKYKFKLKLNITILFICLLTIVSLIYILKVYFNTQISYWISLLLLILTSAFCLFKLKTKVNS